MDLESYYGELKSKVDKLEYVELKEVKDNITDIKLQINTNDLLTKQNVETNERLANTMETMRVAMVEMAQSLKDNNKISSELTRTVENLNEKIDETNGRLERKFTDLNNRVDAIDDKSKVDWQQFVKSKWFEIVLGLGALGYIISQLIK